MSNRLTRKHQCLMYAAPAVLLLVAGVQFYLASAHHLNPIKGGGFGMFAGHNTNVLRTITMVVVSADGRRLYAPLPLTRSYGKLFGELKVMPLDWRVNSLAMRLAREQWLEVKTKQPVALIQEHIQESSKPISYPTEPLHVDEVEITFWEYDFDGSSGKLTRRVLLRKSVSQSAAIQAMS